MTEQNNAGRRRKRFLSPSEMYEIWIALLRGESTTIEVADRAGVDRSTIMKLRQVAQQGALDALAASRPGVRANGGSIRSWRRPRQRSRGCRRRSRRSASG